MKIKIKRIVALILTIAISALCLASCKKEADRALEKSKRYSESHPYKIEVRVDFLASDEEIAPLFEQIKRSVTTVYFEGGKFRSVNDMDITTDGKAYHFTTMHTVVDGKLYRDLEYSVDGVWQQGNKNWAAINEEQTTAVINKSCLIGGVTADGFANCTLTKTDRKALSFCYTDPSGEVLGILERMMTSMLEGACDSVVANSATLIVNTERGRYESARVDCTFEVTLGEKTYTVSCAVYLDYEYDKNIYIAPPHDSGEYVIKELDEITP